MGHGATKKRPRGSRGWGSRGKALADGLCNSPATHPEGLSQRGSRGRALTEESCGGLLRMGLSRTGSRGRALANGLEKRPPLFPSLASPKRGFPDSPTKKYKKYQKVKGSTCKNKTVFLTCTCHGVVHMSKVKHIITFYELKNDDVLHLAHVNNSMACASQKHCFAFASRTFDFWVFLVLFGR